MTKSEIQKTVHLILGKGIKSGANSIHIEQDCDGPRLRYRLNGVLKSLKHQWFDADSSETLGGVISEIKSMAGLDPAEKGLPQNGVLKAGKADREGEGENGVYFTVSTCPSVFGENVTLRQLDLYDENIELAGNQHATHVFEPFESLLEHSRGVILVSGPSGSKRVMTIYSALGWLHHPGLKIVTAEDPIAFSMPGVTQAQVNPARNLTYAKLVHSFLKLDPDVIFLGAMADAETADKGFEAAQGGSLVLSTVRSADAVSAIDLLFSFGVDRGVMASSLLGVLSQISVRKICTSCIKKYQPDKDEWGRVFEKYPSHLIFYKGKGCEECHFTGYSGNTILSELLVIDRDMETAMVNGAGEKEIRTMALKAGMKTMIDDGLMKLNHTTIPEIIRAVPREMLTAHMNPDPVDSPGSMLFAISNPVSQKHVINEMYETYAKLKKKTKGGESKGNPSQFFDFISRSHKNISDRFQCPSVDFSIEVKGDVVAIGASPGR